MVATEARAFSLVIYIKNSQQMKLKYCDRFALVYSFIAVCMWFERKKSEMIRVKEEKKSAIVCIATKIIRHDINDGFIRWRKRIEVYSAHDDARET